MPIRQFSSQPRLWCWYLGRSISNSSMVEIKARFIVTSSLTVISWILPAVLFRIVTASRVPYMCPIGKLSASYVQGSSLGKKARRIFSDQNQHLSTAKSKIPAKSRFFSA
ncbi:hypothetical protein CPT76_00965 [Paenibacillus sp. AR247]|nr:hypothetical protein CPT76_00965 [Paenibacillus sp. AR247]